LILRFIKKLFIFAIIVAIGAAIWFAFAIWSGLYSIYSFPPSKTYPDGSTFVVEREDGEPMFNSPSYKPPKTEPLPEKGGIGFSKNIPRSKKPIELRVIIRLPYIKFAYEKSLEDQSSK